jgi:hypothetical protein
VFDDGQIGLISGFVMGKAISNQNVTVRIGQIHNGRLDSMTNVSHFSVNASWWFPGSQLVRPGRSRAKSNIQSLRAMLLATHCIDLREWVGILATMLEIGSRRSFIPSPY